MQKSIPPIKSEMDKI